MRKLVRHVMLGLGLVAAMAPAQGREIFEISSEFGEASAWTRGYLETAHREMVRLMGNRRVAPPRGIAVTLKRDPAMGGVGGYATEGALGFTSDQWPRDRYRVWILTHELANLFAHHYGGTGGYPADWWADGRSPFPVYVAALVTERCGEKETAAWLRGVDREKRDQQLFWKLDEEFGFGLFARFFKLVREDGIDMGRIGVGAAWPAPDERRSAWTIAYLSLAARKNLAPLFREYGIGREPADWKQRHPEIPFVGYEVSDREVDDLMAVRAHLFGGRARGAGADVLRELFRAGATWRADGAGAAVGVGGAPASPIAFALQSDFGDESQWTVPFLSRAAAHLVALLDDPRLVLPERVPVVLRKMPDLGGIGGGAQAASIEMLSNVWPEERFRHWILATELARLFGHHLGGQLPDDWWGQGGKPFATYVAALLLEKMGHGEEAAWVRDMHRGKAGHELLWELHEEYGFALFARFFKLLRDDGLVFEKLAPGAADAQRIRSLYLVAYLSIAAKKNLAPLFRVHRIGERGPESAAGFAAFRISDAAVERLMERRGELFGGRGGDARARARFLAGGDG